MTGMAGSNTDQPCALTSACGSNRCRSRFHGIVPTTDLDIANHLREAIRSGEAANGSRLPPERRLAALLGVNRTTIVNAYRELAADGLVSGQVGRGTVVTYGVPASAPVESTGTHPAAQTRGHTNGHGQPRADAPVPWGATVHVGDRRDGRSAARATP